MNWPEKFIDDQFLHALTQTWTEVLRRNPGKRKEDFEMRMVRPDDWDGMTESDYSYDWSTDGDQTTTANRFYMDPIDKFEAVCIVGFANGNVNGAINHIEVWIGDKKVREWPGFLINAELNDLYFCPDPISAYKTERLKVLPNTSGAATDSRFQVIGFLWKVK